MLPHIYYITRLPIKSLLRETPFKPKKKLDALTPGRSPADFLSLNEQTKKDLRFTPVRSRTEVPSPKVQAEAMAYHADESNEEEIVEILESLSHPAIT